MVKEAMNTPKELITLPATNPSGEIREVSLVGSALAGLFSLTLLGVLIGAGIYGMVFGVTFGKGMWQEVVAVLIFAGMWLPWTWKIFDVRRKGVVVSSVHDVVILPGSPNTFFDKLKFFFSPSRSTLKLSEIEKLYASERQLERKDKDGNIKSDTIYQLHVAGATDSITLGFGEDRSKRDEVRNAIKSVGKMAGLEIEEELDMYG